MVLYGQDTITHIREHYLHNETDQQIINTLRSLEERLGESPVNDLGDLTEAAREMLHFS